MIPNKKTKMKAVNSEYNVPVTIMEKQVTVDEMNAENSEYVEVGTAWCRVVPQTGKMASMPDGTRLAKVTHKVEMLFGAGHWIDEDMRLVIGGRNYDIEFKLDPYEEHVKLEFFCEEVRM